MSSNFATLAKPAEGDAPAGSSGEAVYDKAEAERIERLGLALASRAPPQLQEYLKKAAPVLGVIGATIERTGPHLAKFFLTVYDYYCKMPKRAAQVLWSLCITFFGGRYAVAIAAFEAFNTSGGRQLMMYAKDLEGQLKKVLDANALDDKRPSVVDLEPKALAMRKMTIFVKNADPDKLLHAIGGLWSGYLGIVVALKFQFAKTVALANSIGDELRPLLEKVVAPHILSVAPDEYRPWVHPGINMCCKTVALIISWRLSRIISSVQSAVKGGLMASQFLFAWAREKKIVTITADETYADEIVGWSIVTLGIYQQLINGGRAPFPLNVFMLPMDIVERLLQTSITFMTSTETPMRVKDK